MDVFMCTQDSDDAVEAAFVEVVRACQGQSVKMLHEDNAVEVERMIEWQTGIGRDGVTAADVEPLLNGYFRFDKSEIKDVDAGAS